MLRVAVTGGIGSGKSEVARLLASYGAVVIDADEPAREVARPGTPGLTAVVERFGRDVLRDDGSLDRERLGRLVFSDPEQLAALNAIVHPLVGRRMRELAAAVPPDAVMVYDVPLLVENDLGKDYDVVVVVDVPPELQVERLRSRGLPEEDARARMAAQATREDRLAAAHVVIDNSGTLEDLARQVAEFWASLSDSRS